MEKEKPISNLIQDIEKVACEIYESSHKEISYSISKKEIIGLFDDFINEIQTICYNAQSPKMDNSHQFNPHQLLKRCLQLHNIIHKKL